MISNKVLVAFAAQHQDASAPLQLWRKTVQAGLFLNFAALKKQFRAVDKVGDLCVFDIGGNKYRLIAFIHFRAQICYVKQVLTHAEYDTGKWRQL
ncbi:MAG: type II toxin-antitoxin system HigB family toxin [Gammaproteobacteria bacterium]